MNKIVGLLMVTLVVALAGCSGLPSSSAVMPAPPDELRYQTTIITSRGETAPADFAFVGNDPVQVNGFCAGCSAEYYLSFWYVPKTTDRYIGNQLDKNQTIDTATLSKPLYKNDELGVDYLDSIYEIVGYVQNGRELQKIDRQLWPTAYDVATRQLTIDGFAPNSQVIFDITYFHALEGTFKVYYVKPTSLMAGYTTSDEVRSWVALPADALKEKVSPFMVRSVPIKLQIPAGTAVEPGYKFSFWVKVEESIEGTGLASNRAYAQTWLVTCR